MSNVFDEIATKNAEIAAKNAELAELESRAHEEALSVYLQKLNKMKEDALEAKSLEDAYQNHYGKSIRVVLGLDFPPKPRKGKAKAADGDDDSQINRARKPPVPINDLAILALIENMEKKPDITPQELKPSVPLHILTIKKMVRAYKEAPEKTLGGLKKLLNLGMIA